MVWSLLGATLGKEKALYPVYSVITGILQHSPLLRWFLYFVTPRAQGALTDTSKLQEQPGYDKPGMCPYPSIHAFPRRTYPPPHTTADPQGLSLLAQNRFFPLCKRLIHTEPRYLIYLVYILANKGISVHWLHVTEFSY